MTHPKRLNNNQLVDVSAEVRFSSAIPQDAILGLVYAEIKGVFGEPEPLPIQQLPSKLREADSKLKYQALYRFVTQGHTLKLGPRNVVISTAPYKDWDSAAPMIRKIVETLDKVKVIGKVERTGLRYVNFFEGVNVLEHSTLTLKVGDKSISDDKILLRAERGEGEFIVVVQLSNHASTDPDGSKAGSIFDIDVIDENIALKPGANTADALLEIFVRANAVADDIFFGMLKRDFIHRFDPVY